MAVLAVLVGGVLVVSSFADLLNTLVATHTSRRKYWFTHGFELLAYHEARQASAGHRYARGYVIARDLD